MSDNRSKNRFFILIDDDLYNYNNSSVHDIYEGLIPEVSFDVLNDVDGETFLLLKSCDFFEVTDIGSIKDRDILLKLNDETIISIDEIEDNRPVFIVKDHEKLNRELENILNLK